MVWFLLNRESSNMNTTSMKRASWSALLIALALAAVAGGCGERESSTFIRHDPPASTSSEPKPSAAAGAGPTEKIPLRVPDATTLPEGPLGDAIKRGRRIAEATYEELPGNVGNGLHCTSCHLAGGTTAGAAPWVGLTGVFPEYRARSGKVATLEERIDDCFERSMNGKALPAGSPDKTAIVAYIGWLSKDVPVGRSVEGRGFERLAAGGVQPDKVRGKDIFAAKCAACHGADGLGKPAGSAYQFPPLWGEKSFNVGAGMARLETAAGFVKAKMPLGAGGTLSDRDAYDVAAYFTTQPRPDFAAKTKDWPHGGKPKDARY